VSLFQTVLHPTDFSTQAAAARPLAAAFGRDAEALHVLYVDGLFGSEPRDKTQRRLDRYAAPLPGARTLHVERAVAPASGILETAVDLGADLIVMGTHGRRGLSRALLGSVAREVVQLAPCPVLTVRGRGAEGADAVSLDGARLLVAVDFSGPSISALAEGAHLARAVGGTLDVVFVVEPPFPSVAYSMYPVVGGEPDAEAVDQITADLERLLDETAGDGVRKGRVEVVEGAPAARIADTAERLGSALLVVGTRGRRGIDHFLLGSVAEGLVRTAPCPVLTVKDDLGHEEAQKAVRARRVDEAGPERAR
jgi:nucleotide-binding universal stress UspA family protein